MKGFFWSLALNFTFALIIWFVLTVWRRDLRRSWAWLGLRLTPRRSVNQVRAGQRCAIVGRIGAQEELLTSPLGRPSVFYRMHILRRSPDSDGVDILTTLYKRGEAVGFVLEDATGVIAVDIEGATFACKPIASGTWTDADPAMRDVIERALGEVEAMGFEAQRRAYEAEARAVLEDRPVDLARFALTESSGEGIEYELATLSPGDGVIVAGRVLQPTHPSDQRWVIGDGTKTYVGDSR
jgi:hypothetical protein